MPPDSSEPLVSCLCPTRGRVALLRRAVACFRAQTYPSRELVIVHPANDAETREYLATLNDASIRAIAIPDSSGMPAGTVRNLAMDASRGEYFAVWDDDDWSAPTRLEEQMGALNGVGLHAILLSRVILYDGVSKSGFVSAERSWERTLIAERRFMPRYSDLPRGSDSELVERLGRSVPLGGLDRPHLYAYVYHGGNAWPREHWDKNLLAYARPLPAEDSRRLAALLAGEQGSPAAGD